MKDIVGGTALAGLFSLCANGFHVVSSEFSYWFSIGSAVTRIPLGFSTALLGAGYLIGIASGMAILVGTLLAWYIFVPYLTSTLIPADGQSAAAFANAIWAQKVRFIGAGCIGIAAVWTLIRLAKPVVDGIKMSINACALMTQKKRRLSIIRTSTCRRNRSAWSSWPSSSASSSRSMPLSAMPAFPCR